MANKIVGRATAAIMLPLLGSFIAACSSAPAGEESRATEAEALKSAPVSIAKTTDGIQQASAPAGAKLIYRGGRVISNVQVVPVLYGSGTYISQVSSTSATAGASMFSFYRDITVSTYFDWLTEYNTTISGGTNQAIGHGTAVTTRQITPAASRNGTTITDASIQAELCAQLSAGTLPAPTHDAAGNNNTYYAIFFPKGKHISLGGTPSCQAGGFCAYHGTVASCGGKGEVYYGVHPDMSAGSGCDTGCGNASTTFANQTSVASHELVEATTDPEVGIATVIGKPLAWYDATNGEIGDICNAQQGTVTSNGFGYNVQKEFSNKCNDCVLTNTGCTGGGGGGCTHSDCTTGGPLVSGCNSCVTSICSADPFCCNTSWDSICVGEVGSICGQTCP